MLRRHHDLAKIGRRVALCAAAAFAGSLAFAQSSSVTLHVMAKGTGAPVSRVEIKAAGAQAFTDKAGDAQVQIPPGDGDVELYRHSYEVLKIPFADLRGKATAEIYLFPASPADNEVLVKGTKRPETSRKTISIQEATKVAPGGDPAQVPKLLPGVQSSPFSPQIVVRGSGPEDSRYFIDEWTVPFIFHRIGNISIIPDQLLSDVEFSSGGFGAQYGGASGGVVTLKTKTEIPERSKFEFRVNLPVYSSLYYERPLDDQSMIAVSARRSYVDKILPIVLKKAGDKSDLNVAPYFGDEHLYYVKNRDDGHFKVLAMQSYDGLHLITNSDFSDNEDGRATFDLKDTVYLLGVEYTRSIDRDWTLTFAPYVNDTKSNVAVVGNRIDVEARSAVLHAEFARKLTKNERLYLGGEGAVISGQAKILAPKPNFNDPFFDFEEAPKVSSDVKQTYTSVASWAVVDQEFGPVTLTPGVRVFYTSQIKRSGADPRLNARYALNEANTLKMAVGQYSQAPQFRDTSKDFGNPNLKYIRSNHYVLGVETKWDDRWQTDFQTFYKRTFDEVRSNAKTNADNSGDLLAAGFEAFIRRNLTERFFGWLSYTYSKNRQRNSDQDVYHNSQYDQTNVVALATSYKLTSIWETGGRVQYHTGDTFTQVDDAVYNANFDKYQPRTSPGTALYSARLPSYHEVDIYANRDVLFDTWTMTFRFGVEFLALKRQVAGAEYNYDFSKQDYFKGVPPIPYVEVRGVL